MAGTFPDVPGSRIPYDIDGTAAVVYMIAGGSVSTATNSDLRKINNNSSYGNVDFRSYPGNGNNFYLTFLFPEPRTITGYYINSNSTTPSGGRVIATSTNSTTGQNGTWTNVTSAYVNNLDTVQVAPLYRSSIQTVNWANITGLRIAFANRITVVHLYGTIPTAGSPDRLRVVDLSSNDIAAQLDFGDVMQRNNVTKQFKIKNNSSTKTADNITVALSALTDASPTLIGQYQVSTDNTAFANAINIGSLAPGASSGTLYVKLNVDPAAQLGPWMLRITATANSWT